MEAFYIRDGKVERFSIGLEQRSDGTVGPPYGCVLRYRPCASGVVAVVSLVLDCVDQVRRVAMYRVVSLPPAGDVPEPQSGPGDG